MAIEHVGNTCPVDPEAVVEYALADDRLYVDRAGNLAWNIELPEEGRILSYRVVAYTQEWHDRQPRLAA